MRFIAVLLLVSSVFSSTVRAEVPLRDFARWADFEDIRLSPNGDYIAMTKMIDDHVALGFIRLADFTATGGLNFGKMDHVVDFWWVGPDRVVATLGISFGMFEQPFLTGEMRGVDVDGGQQKYLFGQRGAARKGTRIESYNTYVHAWAEMIDPLPREPDWALIKVSSFGRDVPFHELHRINVYTGERRKELVSPAEHISYYLTDQRGRVRYAAGMDQKRFQLRAFVRENDKWSPVAQGDLAKAQILPLHFSEPENAAYFMSNELDGDRDCLIRQHLGTGKRSPLLCDPTQSLAGTIELFDRSRPAAGIFAAGKPEIRVIDPESVDGKVLSTLLNTFPGKALDHFSASLDGSKLLFRVYNDRDPGSYFLLDVAKGKIKRLLAARPWIKPEQMGERRPLSYKTRDGRTIHGFLTLPAGRDPKQLPLVVHPHGGPFGVRDTWRWEADPQMLASRGYGVLQVNFRGSGGHGTAHYEAGKKNWGADMINDITDGLHYVTEQGFVDPQRVCIYGASYGGYAALMSAVREPDAYKCAIGYVGVYDLVSFKRQSDIGDTMHGEDFMDQFMGNTPEGLREQSPLAHIEKLKAAVLIVHGEEDKRAPFEQAEDLRDAVDARKHPYEWLSKRGEGRGFYNEANRIELYEKMLAFLDKHIGKASDGLSAGK
jgi:dipeptidyl aminopeptidase/acylaminoacyl peptidase